jgi:NitT/TauT family transport system substrate-binding protein
VAAPPPPPAAAPTAAAAAAAPTVVRTARVQGLGNILQVALMRGYFREQGIDLQEVQFGSAVETMPPLASGELDAGSTAPLPSFFNALARGIRLTLALDATHTAPGTGGLLLLARLADGRPVVQELGDLRGKHVAQPTGGNLGEMLLERMLGEVGLQWTDLPEVQHMTYPNTLAAFGGGSIDLTIGPEPWGVIAEERSLGTRVRDVSSYLPGAVIAMIVFSEQFARERPRAAEAFAVAYLRAARDYMDAMEHGRDREGMIALLAAATGMEPRVLEKAGYLPINRNGRINTPALASYLDWTVERGYVPQKPDLAALVDHRFADHAARTLDAAR